MPRFTDLTNGQPVFINPEHVVYVEPGGNDTYTNIYLATHGMKKVKESFEEVAAGLEPVLAYAELEITSSGIGEEAAQGLLEALNEAGIRDEGDPQTRETTGGNKTKNKNQPSPEPAPAGPPEKKAETEAGES